MYKNLRTVCAAILVVVFFFVALVASTPTSDAEETVVETTTIASTTEVVTETTTTTTEKTTTTSTTKATTRKPTTTRQATTTKRASYDDSQVMLLARGIMCETGNCGSYACKLTGCVMMNNVKRTGRSLYSILHDSGMYGETASRVDSISPDNTCIEAARAVLSGEFSIPSSVIYQAPFKQGSGVYASVKCYNGVTMYYCYR